MTSPPAKKPRIVVEEPPVEINVDISAIPDPTTVLPNNPLIPKFFGFENMNQFEVKREKTPEPQPPPAVPTTSNVEVPPKKPEEVAVIKHSEEKPVKVCI